MIHFAVYSVSEMIILKTFALKRKGKERRVLARESCTGSHGVTPPPPVRFGGDSGTRRGPRGRGRGWEGLALQTALSLAAHCCAVLTTFSHPQEERKNAVLLFSFLLFCAVGNLKLVDHGAVLSLCACWTGQESTASTRNPGRLARPRSGREGGAGLPR